VAPVAQQVPVLATEIGENDCAGGFLNTLLPWADSHQIGYLAWAWNAANCQSGPSLVSDYAGTPTGYGAAYKSYLAAHPVTAMVTRAALRVSAARKKIRRPRSCPAKHGRRRGHHRPATACRPSSTRKRGHPRH
jgi:hypothetical protein